MSPVGTRTKLARSVRRHPAVALVVAVYLVGLAVLGLVTGSRLTIPYVLIVAVSSALSTQVSATTRTPTPARASASSRESRPSLRLSTRP